MTRQDSKRKNNLEMRMFASRGELLRNAKDSSSLAMSKSQMETVTPAEIAEFLHLSAISHKAFFCYVKMCRIDDLFRTGRLYLSRLSEMNDLSEYVNSRDANRTYLACFSFGVMENMAMWKLYGGCPEESVRLEFGGQEVVKYLSECGKHKVYRVDSSGSITDDVTPDVEEWSFHDVAYKYGQSLCWNHKVIGTGRCRLLSNPFKISELENRIKSYGWMSENEVRLVIKLKAAIPNMKHVAVDFRGAIQGMKIRLGPVCSKRMRLHRIFDNRGIEWDDSRISESKYEVEL